MFLSPLRVLKFVFSTHLLLLVIQSLFRLALYIKGFDLMSADVKADISLSATSFIRGVWFDNVITCYISIVPLVCLFILFLIGKVQKKYCVYAVWLVYALLGSFSIALSAANVPYFIYFFRPINSSILNWSSEAGEAMSMILGESSYILPITMGMAGIFAFVFCSFNYARQLVYDGVGTEIDTKSKILSVPVFGVVIALTIFGIRGRMGYNPIKVSAAYHCNDPFLNQLGINPSFNLMSTYIDDLRKENKSVHLIDIDSERKEVVLKSVVSETRDSLFMSELRVMKRPNVIMILMESMSFNLCGFDSAGLGLTPFLDSLSKESYFFDNCFSSGCHTNQGLYSALYGRKTVLSRNHMKGSNISSVLGLPTVLRDNGYNTYFYMSHESQYDNMNAFLRTNGYVNIRSQEDYPSNEVVNSFGVSDRYLLEYASDEILRQAQSDTAPIFATILTISNHPPYIVPGNMNYKSDKDEFKIVEYADGCLKDFFYKLREDTSFFNNTIFVFCGDHGKVVGIPECDIPTSFNHVPLIIYSDVIGNAKKIGSLCSQTDISPTILSLLNYSVDSLGFVGIDQSRHVRRYVAYTTDAFFVLRDTSHLLLINAAENTESAYNVKDYSRILGDSLSSEFEYLRCYYDE